jgi:hypothetical protein
MSLFNSLHLRVLPPISLKPRINQHLLQHDRHFPIVPMPLPHILDRLDLRISIMRLPNIRARQPLRHALRPIARVLLPLDALRRHALPSSLLACSFLDLGSGAFVWYVLEDGCRRRSALRAFSREL